MSHQVALPLHRLSQFKPCPIGSIHCLTSPRPAHPPRPPHVPQIPSWRMRAIGLASAILHLDFSPSSPQPASHGDDSGSRAFRRRGFAFFGPSAPASSGRSTYRRMRLFLCLAGRPIVNSSPLCASGLLFFSTTTSWPLSAARYACLHSEVTRR